MMLLSDLAVTCQAPVLVPPAAPTPSQILYLSNLDDQLFLRFTIKYIFLYQKQDEVEDEEQFRDQYTDEVRRLRDALSRVLVFYHPLAGRLRPSHQEPDKLEVVCSGEGAVFVEAYSDLSLQEFQRCPKPCKSWKKLLYKVEAGSFVDIPPLVVQVTRLRCGGFVLCVGMSHALCDGLGSSQFLQAWGEISRGAGAVPVAPCWGRDLLRPRCPPLVEYAHPMFTKVQDLSNLGERLKPDAVVCSSVSFGREQITELKAMGGGRYATSFEVLAAHVWRCWIRALDLPAMQIIKLLFSANVRKRLQPHLPPGFYGNGFVLACAETTVRDLTESSLAHAVKLVQKAKAALSDEYVRSMVDYLADKSVRPDLVASLVISQWSRLELTEVDFGWGKPRHVGPLGSDIYCLFSPSNDGRPDGVTVLLSVPRTVFDKYEHYMKNFSEPRPPANDAEDEMIM